MPKLRTLTLNPALDINMFFTRPRLGALNRERHSYLEASGKGLNVAAALARQGLAATAVVPLGGPFGQVMKDMLAAAGFDLRVVGIAGASRANTKVIDDESGEMTEFNAAGPRLSSAELAACERVLLEGLVPGDVAILSGSLPPGSPPGAYAELVTAVRARGAAALVDASGEALRMALEAGPALAKPNRHEAETLLGSRLETIADGVAAAREIAARGAERVVLSLGAGGALFLGGEDCLLARPPTVKARSTTGCGDALLAGTLIGQLRGWSWQRTARHATAMATARAGIEGPGFPDPADSDEVATRVRVIPAADLDPDAPLGE